MTQGRIDTRYLVAGTVLALAAIGGFVAMALTIGEDFVVPAIIALGVVAAVVFKGPVGKGLARRIESGTGAEPSPELAAELDDMRGRIMELEERLDFTERMLSKAREPERVNGAPG
jgi:hypothetical protein